MHSIDAGRRMGRFAATLFILNLFALGCGDNSAYLPKPRPPADDEDEAPAVVVAPEAKPASPSGGAAPTAASAKTNALRPANAMPAVAKPAIGPATNPVGGVAKAGDGPSPAVTASAPPASTSPAADSQAPAQVVVAGMSELERRTKTIAQMRRISQALETFRAKNDAYPDPVIAGGRLSWRVALLPYLGFKDLYLKFRMDEPWDGPNNRLLLNEIPDVYRSHELNDDRTAFLFLTGSNGAFCQPTENGPGSMVDGVANTILLAEFGATHAQPWTAPKDYVANPETWRRDLFELRRDCVYVVMGGMAAVRRVEADIPADHLAALISPNKRDKANFDSMTQYAHPELNQTLLDRLASGGAASGAPSSETGGNAAVPGSTAAASAGAAAPTSGPPSYGPTPPTRAIGYAASPGGSNANQGAPAVPGQSNDKSGERWPVPDDGAVEKANELVRDLYKQEYDRAKKPSERREFARRLLDDVDKASGDAVGTYVLLRSARDIAARSGGVEVTTKAIDQLEKLFQVDGQPMRLKSLEQVATTMEGGGEFDRLYDASLAAGDRAVDEDDFNGAKTFFRLAMNAARRTNNKEKEKTIGEREDHLAEAKRAYNKVSDQLHALLRSPDNPKANAAAGRYFALTKQDWSRGLPQLARGDDGPLAEIARRDLAGPTGGDEQVALGDLWWDWSDKTLVDLEKSSARSRARHWYREALKQLPSGLARMKAEKRLEADKRKS